MLAFACHLISCLMNLGNPSGVQRKICNMDRREWKARDEATCGAIRPKKSNGALAVIGIAWLTAGIAFAPTPASAGGSGWAPAWEFYGGRFVVSAPPGGHEYQSFNSSCVWLRRVVPTPLGPRWQLFPVCV